MIPINTGMEKDLGGYQSIDGHQGDLDDFVGLLFGGAVLPHNSVQFAGDFASSRDLFEALLMVFTKGMRLCHGNESGVVDLNQVTPSQIEEITRRFLSFGITIKITRYHQVQVHTVREEEIPSDLLSHWMEHSDDYPELLEPRCLDSYQEVNSDNLGDYYFQLRHQNHCYILQFINSVLA